MHNLLSNAKFTRLSDAAASGNSAVSSNAVDSKGFDSCTFLVALGSITANTTASVIIQQSHDDGNSDAWAPLAATNTALTSADSGKLVGIEVVDAQERYLRAFITRQAAAVDAICAIQSCPKIAPVAQDSNSVSAATIVASPSE
jgi:hypothetical protein